MNGHLHVVASDGPSPARTPITLDRGLQLVARAGAPEHWMAVLVTQRPVSADTATPLDPNVSVVIAGILPHPLTHDPVVAFVSRGGTARLRNLRRHPRATLVYRSGWDWIAVTGRVELAGPDDAAPGLGADGVRTLLRDIFHAAGGIHDDLDAYDEVMAREHRTAVLLHPERFTTNPPGSEHVERH